MQCEPGGADVGFDFGCLLFVDEFEWHVVDVAAAFEFVQAFDFAFVSCDDEFAAIIHSDCVFGAIFTHHFISVAAEFCLQRICGIIEPRMQHAAIAAGMVRDVGFFFNEGDGGGRVAR